MKLGYFRLDTKPGVDIVRGEDKLINAMVEEWHYIHRKRQGRSIGYWVTLDHEIVGAVLYNDICVPYPKYRDYMELSRYYLHPDIQGGTVTDSKGKTHTYPIASRSIGLSLKQLLIDFVRECPHRVPIYGIISWSDNTMFDGTIYKAINCVLDNPNAAGPTSRESMGKPTHEDYHRSKTRWVYTYSKKYRNKIIRNYGRENPSDYQDSLQHGKRVIRSECEGGAFRQIQLTV